VTAMTFVIVAERAWGSIRMLSTAEV